MLEREKVQTHPIRVPNADRTIRRGCVEDPLAAEPSTSPSYHVNARGVATQSILQSTGRYRPYFDSTIFG